MQPPGTPHSPPSSHQSSHQNPPETIRIHQNPIRFHEIPSTCIILFSHLRMHEFFLKIHKKSLQLQLFTQTNESSRHLTQYRCHFRRDISYVVGDSSARSRWRLRRPQPGCRRRWLDAPTSFALGRHDRRAAGMACRRAAQGGGGAFLLQSAATAESSLGRCSWMPFINEAPASSKDPNPERD